MASQSETGHPINVANFEKLISHCTGFGAAYNPSQAAIKLAALNTQKTTNRTALDTVNTKYAKLKVAQNNKQLPFETLDAFITRVVSALDASGPTQKIVADVRSLAKKIAGIKASTEPLPEQLEQTPGAEAKIKKIISSSQQSSDAKLENLRKLVELIKEEPAYNPNETDLKTTALTALVTNLTAKITALVNASTDFDNALTNRDNLQYNPNTGLVDTAQEIKKYIKSVYGASSREFKQISDIKFTRH